MKWLWHAMWEIGLRLFPIIGAIVSAGAFVRILYTAQGNWLHPMIMPDWLALGVGILLIVVPMGILIGREID